ncbi:MAG: metallophosphoesterase [Bryobacterales bacterium]|nr:metallophosphoesterase [Bryobacterales bacterium]
MSVELPVARVVHLSDLHFGDQFENREEWWHEVFARTPLQGRYRHDYAAAVSLRLILEEIRADAAAHGVPLVVVHTGDLTAAGKEAEFAVGAAFLQGLGEVHEVPGNHDLWGYEAGQAPGWYSRHFPDLLPVICLGGRIILYRLNSNKHSEPFWDATGRVELSAVEEMRAHAALHPAAIRVVLMHHPIRVTGAADEALLRLDDREQVGELLGGMDVVMSGHVHVSQAHTAADRGPMQCIAGTATQMGHGKSFLVTDVYEGGFDVREYGMRGLQFAETD